MAVLNKPELELFVLLGFLRQVEQASRTLATTTLTTKAHGKVVAAIVHALRIYRLGRSTLELDVPEAIALELTRLMQLHVTCARVEKILLAYARSELLRRPLPLEERSRHRLFVEHWSASVPPHIASRFRFRLTKMETRQAELTGKGGIILLVPRPTRPRT